MLNIPRLPLLTTYQRLVLKLLLAIFDKQLSVPGVATYDEDKNLVKEVERVLDNS